MRTPDSGIASTSRTFASDFSTATSSTPHPSDFSSTARTPHGTDFSRTSGTFDSGFSGTFRTPGNNAKALSVSCKKGDKAAEVKLELS